MSVKLPAPAAVDGLFVITPELFVVPDAERPLLYAPLKGLVFSVKPALVERLRAATATTEALETFDPALCRLLNQLGLLDDASSPLYMPPRPVHDRFEPTGVILLVTTVCNLRCHYCYADAGDYEPQLFDRDVARAGIRLAIDNAARRGEPRAHVAFHGGGEPTQDFRLIREAIAFAREYAESTTGGSVSIETSLVTNGVLSQKKAQWLAENITSVQVSLDGPQHLHDMQRPLQDGSSTHARVVDTAKLLEANVPDMMIKSTISRATVGHMAEIAEFMCETFDLPRFHFGPVLSAGRGRGDAFGQPDVDDFVAGYIEAQAVADRYGREIVVSGALTTFPKVRATYCGVTDPNFAINVNGSVTGCYEVIYEDDPRSDRFHYGRYVPETGEFEIDRARLLQLRGHDVTKIPKCQNCFAKWHCAGDCQARWYNSADGSDEEGIDVRCEVNRSLIRRELYRLVESS